MAMSEEKPECFGTKRCPKGPKNASRVFCPLYTLCIDELIARELGRTNSIVRTLKAVRKMTCDEDGFGLPDFLILTWIGTVAVRNGYRYGRKKVDRAISLSNIDEDGECASTEKSFVRVIFGVYGRKSNRIGGTPATNEADDTDGPLSEASATVDGPLAVSTRTLRSSLAVRSGEGDEEPAEGGEV